MSNILKFIVHFQARFFLNKDERKLVERLKELNNLVGKDTSDKELRITVQIVEEYFFLIKFYLFFLALVKKYKKIEVDFIVLSDPLFRRGKSSFLKKQKIYDRKWIKLYEKLFNGKIAFNFNDYLFPPTINQKKIASEIHTKLLIKSDVLKISYKNYEIGPLIYDYYLRVENVPTVDIKSEILLSIISNSIRAVDFFESYFKEKKPRFLLTCYVTYITHGIPALIASRSGCDVLHFSGTSNVLCKQLSKDIFSHVKDYTSYKLIKDSISSNDFQLAKMTLEDRFKGKIDNNISYMRKSAYSTSDDSEKIKTYNKPVVIIFLHCFFDSPHIYRWMLFPDFYEWLSFTLENLNQNKNVKVLLKQHPNALEGNNEIINEFLKKYPDVDMLDSSLNNLSIVKKLNPIAVLTVYGTVAYEMGYLGVPVFCTGDNPHIDFCFQKTFTSVNEYLKFLIDLPILSDCRTSDLEKNIEDSIKFYYLHSTVNMEKCFGILDVVIQNNLKDLFFKNDLLQFLNTVKHNELVNIILSIQTEYY